MKDRFKYYQTTQMIMDELTGYTYYGNKEICDLLNQVNQRADKNAEKYYKVMDKCRKYKFDSKSIGKK